LPPKRSVLATILENLRVRQPELYVEEVRQTLSDDRTKVGGRPRTIQRHNKCRMGKTRSRVAFCRLACVMALCVHQFRVLWGIPISSIHAIKLGIFQGQLAAAVSTFAILLLPF
jgi:hypothetical protein